VAAFILGGGRDACIAVNHAFILHKKSASKKLNLFVAGPRASHMLMNSLGQKHRSKLALFPDGRMDANSCFAEPRCASHD